MAGSQGYFQISSAEAPRDSGRGAIRAPGLPPPPVGRMPYSRPQSRMGAESLPMPIPMRSRNSTEWSYGHEDDSPTEVRRERGQRHFGRSHSPRRAELRSQHHDIRGSRHTLTAREDLSSFPVVQIDQSRTGEDGSLIHPTWERTRCFQLHVTKDEAIRKIDQLERETEPVLDKIQKELPGVMQEKLEYARQFLEDEEDDPYFTHELLQFEATFQKVDRSLRDSQEELHHDWNRSSKTRSKSKDKKRQKSKHASKSSKKHKHSKDDRGRSSSSKSKHKLVPVSITAYFKRTPLQPESRPQLFKERESETSWEDNEMSQHYRGSPTQYEQRNHWHSDGRDWQQFSDYKDTYQRPSHAYLHDDLDRDRHPMRDYRDPYDMGYQAQDRMAPQERPATNHHQQQYNLHPLQPQQQPQQHQYNMGQQQPQQQQQQQQQQQYNMQQAQPAMGQQRPQQQQQQDRDAMGHQGFNNHQDHQGYPPVNQQRQAPAAPQGQGGMAQQQQQQQQPAVNQPKQQGQPSISQQQQPTVNQQKQQGQPGMAQQQQPVVNQPKQQPQPQQPAVIQPKQQPQPGMAHQPQQPAVVQQKQQGQPGMAQQQQPQQQPAFNQQKQQGQPGMAQQHPQQPANKKQAQPATLHQHGQKFQGQEGRAGGSQTHQQKAQAMPPQGAAQPRDQSVRRAAGENKGDIPPPPRLPPLQTQVSGTFRADGQSKQDKRKVKASPRRHHAHPVSPRVSETSVSDYEDDLTDSASELSTPASSMSGASRHKAHKRDGKRYIEEHRGIPSRHHVKPGRSYIDEEGYARELPPSPRRSHLEEKDYAREIPSSPRRSHLEEKDYAREIPSSPRKGYMGERGYRDFSSSPRRNMEETLRRERDEYSRSPPARISPRHENPAPRIIQSVRRVTPDEVGRELLDGEGARPKNRLRRPSLEEDQLRGWPGQSYKKGDYEYTEKRRRAPERGFDDEVDERYERRYEKREDSGYMHRSDRSDRSDKYGGYRDSRSPERAGGRRAPTYATRT